MKITFPRLLQNLGSATMAAQPQQQQDSRKPCADLLPQPSGFSAGTKRTEVVQPTQHQRRDGTRWDQGPKEAELHSKPRASSFKGSQQAEKRLTQPQHQTQQRRSQKQPQHKSPKVLEEPPLVCSTKWTGPRQQEDVEQEERELKEACEESLRQLDLELSNRTQEREGGGTAVETCERKPSAQISLKMASHPQQELEDGKSVQHRPSHCRPKVASQPHQELEGGGRDLASAHNKPTRICPKRTSPPQELDGGRGALSTSARGKQKRQKLGSKHQRNKTGSKSTDPLLYLPGPATTDDEDDEEVQGQRCGGQEARCGSQLKATDQPSTRPCGERVGAPVQAPDTHVQRATAGGGTAHVAAIPATTATTSPVADEMPLPEAANSQNSQQSS